MSVISSNATTSSTPYPCRSATWITRECARRLASRTAGVSFDRFPQFSISVRNWVDEHLSRDRLLEIVETVRLKEDSLRIELKMARAIPDAPVLNIDVPMTVERRGLGMRLVMDAIRGRPRSTERTRHRGVPRSHLFDEIVTQRISTTEVVRREDVNPTYVSRMVRLALLSPRIVKAIMAGWQPESLNVDALMKRIELPWNWAEQEAILGF